MKTIRRTRITVRKREITIMKNGEQTPNLEENETHVCPLCHSVIHPKPQIPTVYEGKLLTAGIKNLLTEEN